MDDLKLLLVKLNCTPQPLTEAESVTLEKIKQGLRGNVVTEHEIQAMDEPQFSWIEEPAPLKFTLDCDKETKTIFETENIIKVSKNANSGHFQSLSQAVDIAKENSTIVIIDDIEKENILIEKTLHFVAKDNVSLKGTHFEVKSATSTFMGFNFEADDELFNASNCNLSLKNCKLTSTSSNVPISVSQSAILEIIGCELKGNKLIDTQSSSSIKINSTKIEGNLHFSKSDATFNHCMFSNPSGICIESLASLIKIYDSEITNAKEVALSIREHSSIVLGNTLIESIKGAGVLLHSYSKLQAKNIQLSSCEKAGLIVTHDAAAKVSGSAIRACGLAGCEILYQGHLTLNETWVSEHKGSCILSDYRSFINTTRCVIRDGNGHGIEAGNGSYLRINDTLITKCRGSGVLVSSSNLVSMMCQYSCNNEANIVGEDGSNLELTNCSIVDGCSDGIESVSGSVININSCYFARCKGSHLVGRGIKDTKIVSSTFEESIYSKEGALITTDEIKQDALDSSNYDVYGGVSFEQSEMIIIDTCFMNRNSVVINSCKNCIARNSTFLFAVTRPAEKVSKYFEVVDDSNMTIETCRFSKTVIKIRHSSATIRKCILQKAQNFVLNGEDNAHITAEHNEVSFCNQCASIKDNTVLQFSFNKVTSITRPKKKANAESTILDSRVRAFNIREFSTCVFEGNFISGDYDYAVYVDGQSKVDCLTNQIQAGSRGGILYTGMSYGKCDDNEFTGKSKFIEYFNGCSSSRKD